MTIKQIQHLLAYLGFYTLGVDGIWGPGSEKALAAFQRRCGLEETGQAEESTQKALRHAVAYGLPEEEGKEETGTFWDEIEFFTREEFACKCGQYHAPYCDGFPAEPREAMVRIADRVRRELGVPVSIISGLRCRQHNADSGGVANSQHMAGEAADIRAAGLSADTLLSKVLSIPGVRYAYKINDTNVHFDIPKGG